jgi:hypothetical protein
MSKYVGTWVYDSTHSTGDTVKTLRLDVRDSSGVAFGTAVGLGWTPKLEIRKAGDTTLLLTLTGSWEDVLVCDAALFSIGAANTLVPAAGLAPIDYEALLVMDNAGQYSMNAADDNSEPFAFRVARWPA